MPPTVPLEQTMELQREIEAWKDTAAMHCRNEEYYRGLVVRIGEMFGEAAYIADDGGRADAVLCAKVPELVEAIMAKVEVLEMRRGTLGNMLRYIAFVLAGDETADAQLAADQIKADVKALAEVLMKIMPSIILLRPVIGGPWLDTWEREARAILEGHPIDAATAEWQRVHGADVAHWRTRAENAEALSAWQERRIELLEEGGQ